MGEFYFKFVCFRHISIVAFILGDFSSMDKRIKNGFRRISAIRKNN